jgi:hypothetical protein
MKKLGIILATVVALAASPAFAFGHGGGGHGGFHGGGFHGGFSGRSVGHGFGGRGLGWGGAALGLGAVYGASQCYAWDPYSGQWIYVCGYPGWYGRQNGT